MWYSLTGTWSLVIDCYCTMVRAMKWFAGPSYQYMKYLVLFRPKKNNVSSHFSASRVWLCCLRKGICQLRSFVSQPSYRNYQFTRSRLGRDCNFLAHLRKQINGSISRTRRLAQLNFASFDRWAWGAKVDLYLFDINKSGIDWFVLTKWWKRSYLTEQ